MAKKRDAVLAAVERAIAIAETLLREEWDEGQHPRGPDGKIKELSPGQGIEDIRAEYHTTLVDLMLNYMTSDRYVTSYRNEFYRAANEAFTYAANAGWVDGGAPGLLPDEVTEWVGDALDDEMQYITSLFGSLREMRSDSDISDDERLQFISDRADGYTATLDGIYNHAKLARAEIMLTFDGDDGQESCATCQSLKGQRHPARWWIENDLVPGPRPGGNNGFDCKGYECQHFLRDDDFNVWTAESWGGLALLMWAARLREDWDESQHPRDASGKFSDAGGGGGGAATSRVDAADLAAMAADIPSRWPVEAKLHGEFNTAMETTEAADLKGQVVSDLASRSGAGYDVANNLVATWATTSNDTNVLSLRLQQTAARELGVEMSEWQQSRMEKVAGLEDIADDYLIARDNYDDPNASDEERVSAWDDMQNLRREYEREVMDDDAPTLDTFSKKKELADEISDEDVRGVVRATYDATQEHLREMGYQPDDTVMLYRGMNLRSGLGARFGEELEYHGNALESWTTNPGVAAEFGRSILAARIRVSDIWSMPTTGAGCLHEYEVIIKAGKMLVQVGREG